MWIGQYSILLLCMSENKLFERNERFSIAVYCNSTVEKNFHFNEALKKLNFIFYFVQNPEASLSFLPTMLTTDRFRLALF